MQVAQSLQNPRAAETNGSEAVVRALATDISNGLECKLSTQSSKVTSIRSCYTHLSEATTLMRLHV